jgi:hypothetical protein
MLTAALEAEVAAYLARHANARDEDGHALVVRNGHARPRSVTMGSGTVEVSAPRVDDRRVDEDGTRQRFTSEILPPYMRRSPKVAEVLPVLYLRGLERRVRHIQQAESRRPRLRLRLRGRRPLPHPAGGRAPVHPRAGRRSPRRDQGAHRRCGRLPGERRELGGPAPGPRRTWPGCSPSTTSPPSTGSTCVPPTPSSPPSPPCASASASPRALGAARRASRWPTSSWTWPRQGGARSPRLVPLVRAGVLFTDGVKVERSPDPTPSDAKLAA